MDSSPSSPAPFVGLVPAAGQARRLGAIPCSKEILPIGWNGEGTLRRAIDPLLESWSRAGVERALVVTTGDKLDIASAVGSAPVGGPRLAYLVLEGSSCLPETLAFARPFVGDRWAALGFPDVLFEPADAWQDLARLKDQGCDVALAAFPVADPSTTEMLHLDDIGRVLAIEDRPRRTRAELNWLLAAWSPRFFDFLVDRWPDLAAAAQGELRLGALFAAALEAGFELRAHRFSSGRWRDLGTPQGYSIGLDPAGPPEP